MMASTYYEYVSVWLYILENMLNVYFYLKLLFFNKSHPPSLLPYGKESDAGHICSYMYIEYPYRFGKHFDYGVICLEFAFIYLDFSTQGYSCIHLEGLGGFKAYCNLFIHLIQC